MRVGIIGCGLIGKKRAQVICNTAGQKLVMVADSRRDRAQELAAAANCEFTDRWEKVVENAGIDAVIVATTNDWLAHISIAALQSGKHVLCEKPMGRNLTEATEMLQAGRSSRKLLKIGFNHRYHPAVQQAYKQFQDGNIGEILWARCRYGHGGRPGYANEWRMNTEISGGGELLDQGIHAIDLFRWFLGEFDEVMGWTPLAFWTPESRNNSDRLDGDAHAHLQPAEDNAFALFKTSRNQVASLHASWNQWKNMFSFEIYGREGFLSIEGLGGSYGPEHLIYGQRAKNGGPPQERRIDFPGPDASWEREWRDFVSAIQQGSQPLGGAYDGWRVMQLVNAVYQASRSKNAVRVDTTHASTISAA